MSLAGLRVTGVNRYERFFDRGLSSDRSIVTRLGMWVAPRENNFDLSSLIDRLIRQSGAGVFLFPEELTGLTESNERVTIDH